MGSLHFEYFIFSVIISITAILIITHQYTKHLYKGINFLAYATVCLLISFIFNFENIQSNQASFLLKNFGLLMGLLLLKYGLSIFLSYKINKITLIVVPSAVGVLLLFFYFINDVLQIRLLISTLYMVYISFRLFYQSALKYKQSKLIQFTLVAFSILLILMSIRLVYIIIHFNDIANYILVGTDNIVILLIGITLGVLLLALSIYLNRITLHGLKNERQYLKYQSMTDYLTDIPNRRMLEDKINEYIQKNKKFALMITDIDDFKNVNDTFGHEVGDQLIQIYAKKLIELKRTGDFIARFGGDEFIILISDFKNEDQLLEWLSLKINELSQNVYVENVDFKIQISAGIAIYPEDATVIYSLMKRADDALYVAKESGKNKIVMYKNI